MRLQVKGKNLEVPPAIRDYAEAKLAKLDRHLHETAQVELELSMERNPAIADNAVAEATASGPTSIGGLEIAAAPPLSRMRSACCL
jgi:ribosomal subunit interface protein